MLGSFVRAAREEDLERLAEVHAASYVESGGHDRHRRSLTHNAFGGLEKVRVVERGGEIVGLGVLFGLEMWIGGRPVPVGGIGSIGVAPEARRRGVARVLLEALHAEIAAQGGALALLYPFRQRFYAKYGYAAVTPLVSLTVALDSVEAFARGPSAATERARIDASLMAQARALYDELAKTTSGRITRDEARWQKLFANDATHWIGVVSDRGELEGYVAFEYETGAISKQVTVVVHELLAREPSAKRSLLLAIASQRDQAVDVALALSYGDPLALAFEDAAGARAGIDPGQDPIGVFSAGPMVRVVDVRRALALRGYARDGELTFAVADGDAVETVCLSVHAGKSEAIDGSGRNRIELSRATLGSMLAAGMLPSEARELGLLRADPEAVRVADDILGGPRFQCLDPF